MQYGRQTSYSEAGAASKRELVERMLAASGARPGLGPGRQRGHLFDHRGGDGRQVIAFDQDASSVEHHWRTLSAEARASVLPLVMDLTNPSPALGWALEERRSLIQRGPADLVMALALVHHLAIGNNVPLEGIAALFAQLGRQAIVEFVPKQDPMTQHLLAARTDVFPDYTLDGFRTAFARHFTIVDEAPIADSDRTLFLLRSIADRHETPASPASR